MRPQHTADVPVGVWCGWRARLSNTSHSLHRTDAATGAAEAAGRLVTKRRLELEMRED
jgi:hypothetical protein